MYKLICKLIYVYIYIYIYIQLVYINKCKHGFRLKLSLNFIYSIVSGMKKTEMKHMVAFYLIHK